MKLFAIMLLLVLAAPRSVGQADDEAITKDGNGLLRTCDTKSSGVKLGYCLGMIAGVSDLVQILPDSKQVLHACYPEGVTGDQMRKGACGFCEIKPSPSTGRL